MQASDGSGGRGRSVWRIAVLAMAWLAACAPVGENKPEAAAAASALVAVETLPKALAPELTGPPPAPPPSAPSAAAIAAALAAPAPVAPPAVAPPAATPAVAPLAATPAVAPPPTPPPMVCPPGSIGMWSPDAVGASVFICRRLNPAR
jgi:hypothetical protein